MAFDEFKYFAEHSLGKSPVEEIFRQPANIILLNFHRQIISQRFQFILSII